MSSDLNRIRQELQELAKTIFGGSVPVAEFWRGADVVVAPHPLPPAKSDSFYPPPRAVVTAHAGELSWLIERLRDSFAPLLDSASKIEFFGRLANAANRYLQKVAEGDRSAQDLLLAVLHEAHAIRDEMEEGEFKHLLIAPGNAIWDDFVERDESSATWDRRRRGDSSRKWRASIVMLDISKNAYAFLRELPPKQCKQVAARILALTTNAEPHDAKHLSGLDPGYKRIDQGEYRIIYRVDDGVVRVPTVGKRNDDEVYRQFERQA